MKTLHHFCRPELFLEYGTQNSTSKDNIIQQVAEEGVKSFHSPDTEVTATLSAGNETSPFDTLEDREDVAVIEPTVHHLHHMPVVAKDHEVKVALSDVRNELGDPSPILRDPKGNSTIQQMKSYANILSEGLSKVRQVFKPKMKEEHLKLKLDNVHESSDLTDSFDTNKPEVQNDNVLAHPSIPGLLFKRDIERRNSKKKRHSKIMVQDEMPEIPDATSVQDTLQKVNIAADSEIVEDGFVEVQLSEPNPISDRTTSSSRHSSIKRRPSKKKKESSTVKKVGDEIDQALHEIEILDQSEKKRNAPENNNSYSAKLKRTLKSGKIKKNIETKVNLADEDNGNVADDEDELTSKQKIKNIIMDTSISIPLEEKTEKAIISKKKYSQSQDTVVLDDFQNDFDDLVCLKEDLVESDESQERSTSPFNLNDEVIKSDEEDIFDTNLCKVDTGPIISSLMNSDLEHISSKAFQVIKNQNDELKNEEKAASDKLVFNATAKVKEISKCGEKNSHMKETDESVLSLSHASESDTGDIENCALRNCIDNLWMIDETLPIEISIKNPVTLPCVQENTNALNLQCYSSLCSYGNHDDCYSPSCQNCKRDDSAEIINLQQGNSSRKAYCESIGSAMSEAMLFSCDDEDDCKVEVE